MHNLAIEYCAKTNSSVLDTYVIGANKRVLPCGSCLQRCRAGQRVPSPAIRTVLATSTADASSHVTHYTSGTVSF